MNNINANLGHIPLWLQDQLHEKQENHHRLEIEVKLILPKKVFSQFKETAENVIKQEIEQIYLSQALVEPFTAELSLPAETDFKEWRIRHVDQDYFFTAKSAASADGTQRMEYEIGISASLFSRLKYLAEQNGSLSHVVKTRYSFSAPFSDEQVLVQIDDYHEAGKTIYSLDFVSCEVEVPSPELAEILRKGRFFSSKLQFLKQGCNVTGIEAFSNRYLADHGFVAENYSGILEWLHQYYVDDLEQALNELREGQVYQGLEIAHNALARIEVISRPVPVEIDIDDISLTQDVLADIAFTVSDSLGRKDESDPDLKKLDSLGKGWLRDYHEIISANFYIRLHSKPQIFRPGLGYTNTTTRGSHTSDVMASSIQLARQLGLNAELCMAMAAMHDVGHPAGGHVGEQILHELSGRRFMHHIFSLSLVDLFGLNLLREVQIGSFYHKSGGRKLMAPSGRPQEYGVVRIADKVSYAPWDLFDSIANGYLPREEVPKELFEILGNESMEWIRTIINAIVRESAEAHKVQFSDKSGELYYAFQKARELVYQRVHPNIAWGTLRSQMEMCYEKIQLSFSDIDPIPVIGYMTDHELTQLSSLIESQPKKMPLSLEKLEILGFGFCEIIRIMRKKNFNPSNLYYNTSMELDLKPA